VFIAYAFQLQNLAKIYLKNSYMCNFSQRESSRINLPSRDFFEV